MFETIEEYIKAFLKLPPSPMKEYWVKVFHEMSVHTRKRKPDDLLLKTRPHEEGHVLQYRLDNYEAITYGSMNRAFDNLYRLMNAINFNIVADANVLQYIGQNVFDNYTFTMWAQKVTLKRDIEDPNGFLVWMPEGKGSSDSAEKVQPKPYLLYSDKYVYSDNNVYIFCAPETSLYENEGAYHSGKVYWVIGLNSIWKVKQTGPDEAKDYLAEEFYKHNFNGFPVIVLGGDLNADGFHESFFAPYVAFGNQAIRQFSDWQAIQVTSSFPIIEEFATECEIKTRVKRNPENKSNDPEEKYEQRVELKPFHKGPYGIILRPVKTNNDTLDFEGTLPVDIPSRRYITPDIDIAKYAGESWEKLIQKAEEALNLNLTYANQSGVAKEYDNETKYSMINKIGNNFFDNILLNSLKFIDCYLNKKPLDKSNAYINKPTTFNIKTEADLIAEIATLKEKKVPGMILSQATTELARKMFSGSPVAQKMFKVISTYDPLFTYSVEEKDSMLLQNVISKEDYIRSILFDTKLTQINNRIGSDNFVKTSEESLYKTFLSDVQSAMPNATTPLIGADGQPIPPVSQDQEKAQANLRGSVGGVQGILEIQNSVKAGTTSPESGIAILKYIFGFKDDEAKEMLGQVEADPNPQPAA